MFVDNLDSIEKKQVNMPGAVNVEVQVPVAAPQGWEDHVMRVFTIKNMGNTPKHAHDWPHINYIIKGEGVLHMNGKDNPVKAGSVAYVPNNTEHQFRGTVEGEFQFICIVPKDGHY